MKTRTNQPIVLDNGQPVDDSKLGGTKLYKHEIDISISHAGGTVTGKLYLISNNANNYTSGSSFKSSDVICGQSHIRYQGGFRPIVSLGDSMGPNMSMSWIESGTAVNLNVAFTITKDTVTPL